MVWILTVVIALCLLSQVVGKPEVVVLDADSFASEVEGSADSWLVKFYAPWCHHCKTLEPILQELAVYADGIVHIGKVDATKQKELAEKWQVERFPTLLYKKDDLTGVYDGPRTYAGLKLFIDRLHKPAYSKIERIEDLREELKTLHNVTFVLRLPCQPPLDRDGSNSKVDCDATTTDIFHRFVQVSRRQQFHAAFALLVDRSVSSTSFCKFESTEESEERLYCAKNEALESEETMEHFVKYNNYPLISHLENFNFKLLAHLNKTMIIAVVDYKQTDAHDAIVKAFGEGAREYGFDRSEEYILGHLDGVRWKAFIKHHEALLPSILVIDHDDERHASFHLKPVGTTTYTSIIHEIMEKINKGEVELLPTVPVGLVRKIIHRFERYYPWSLLLLIMPCLLLIASFVFPHPDRKAKKQ